MPERYWTKSALHCLFTQTIDLSRAGHASRSRCPPSQKQTTVHRGTDMSHFGFKSRALTTASILALSALPALAQGNADVETVVVTGSQIQMKGFTAPTPVTTVDQKDLQLKAV